MEATKRFRTLTISKEGEPSVYCPQMGTGLSIDHMMQIMSIVVGDPEVVVDFIGSFGRFSQLHPWCEYKGLMESWAGISQLFITDLAAQPSDVSDDTLRTFIPTILFAMFLGMSIGISLEISEMSGSKTVQ